MRAGTPTPAMRIAEAAPFPGDSGQVSVVWSRVAAAAASPKVAKALREAWPAVLMLRIGEPPRRGRSRNYQDGHCEAGVSVYRARATADRIEILAAGLDLKSTRAKFARARLRRKRLFVCLGLCVARGTDNEPVMRLEDFVPLPDAPFSGLRIVARHPGRSGAAHTRLWKRWQRTAPATCRIA